MKIKPYIIQKASFKKGVESADDAIQKMVEYLQKPHPETIVFLREHGKYSDGREFVTITINYNP